MSKSKKKQTIEMVSVKSIVPDPNQPRTEWDEHKEHIDSLAGSFPEQGIIDMIEVDEDNVIVLGECRWRAAKKEGHKVVPIKRIKTPSTQKRLERQLIEDAHKKQYNDNELRWAFATGVANINDPALSKEEKRATKVYTIPEIKLIWNKDSDRLVKLLTYGKKISGKDGGRGKTDGGKAGQAEFARRVNIPQKQISNFLAYFKKSIPEEVREVADEGVFTYTEILETERITTPETKVKVAKSVAEERRRLKEEGKRRIKTSVRDRVDAIKKAEERGASKELIDATATAEIEPEDSEVLSEIPAKVQPEAIKIIKEQPTPLAKKVVARQIAIEVPREAAAVKVSKEKIAELRSQAEAHDKHMAEVRADPLVQEAQRIYKSSSVLFGLQGNVCDAFCPICGEPAEERLRFTCHPDMTIKESYNRTMENHTDVVKKRKSGGTNN